MILLSSLILITSCNKEETNPFLTEWDAPFGTPPFDKIKLEHYTFIKDKIKHLPQEKVLKHIKAVEESNKN